MSNDKKNPEAIDDTDLDAASGGLQTMANVSKLAKHTGREADGIIAVELDAGNKIRDPRAGK